MRRQKRTILVLLLVQVLCAGVFIANVLSSVFGFSPVSWQISEFIELGAGVGLILGIIAGSIALRRTSAQMAKVEDKLRVASGAFAELLNDRFVEWDLTPAEKDVALFSIKGMSTAEIAQMRDTSEGTVKAQTNAIYRKAGVSGRPQLLSYFIEDLMAGPVVGPTD